MEKGIWEGLVGGKGREKYCKYVMSKIKIKMIIAEQMIVSYCLF